MEYHITLVIDHCSALTFRFLSVSWWKIHSHILEFLSAVFARFHVCYTDSHSQSSLVISDVTSPEIYCGVLLFFKAFSAKQQKKSQRKKKSLQRYRGKRIKWQLYGKYYEMSISKNDRSKWPMRLEYDQTSPRSGRTLSIDRLLFWALHGLNSYQP